MAVDGAEMKLFSWRRARNRAMESFGLTDKSCRGVRVEKWNNTSFGAARCLLCEHLRFNQSGFFFFVLQVCFCVLLLFEVAGYYYYYPITTHPFMAVNVHLTNPAIMIVRAHNAHQTGTLIIWMIITNAIKAYRLSALCGHIPHTNVHTQMLMMLLWLNIFITQNNSIFYQLRGHKQPAGYMRPH